MRIATWNVNSVRARIDRVEAFVQRHEVDVLALQETKVPADAFPEIGLQALGYDVAASGRTKKELLMMRREKEKLERTLGGIRDMARVPSAVWIVDTKKEHLAVDEARKLNIPIVAILDTNCDPDEVDYKIPGNDDAIRSVALLTRVVADAVAEGLLVRSGGAGGDAEVGEPMPDWERELLAGEDQGAVVTEETDAQDQQLAEAAAPAPAAPAAAEASNAEGGK